MSIRLVSWNVNGLRAVSAKPEWRWFAENICDVIGLQETKAMPEQLKPEVANPEGWEAHWASSVVKKGYSGVAVFSRIKPLAVRCELPQPEWQGEGRILHLEFEKFHFFNGYFPNGGAEELDENGKPILSAKGKPVLKKSYSVLQDDFFRYMRDAGYDDVERGERGSSEEHLTVTQFKVQQEQARLAELTEQNRQQEQQAATLGKQIEKIQNQQVAVAAIEKIEAKPVPLSSKVILERSEYESLAVAAKKYVASEKKESKLQKALDAANRLIAKLKAEIAGLKQELSEYKSVRSKLRTSDLERENAELRGKVQHYEDVIQRNNLWHFFRPRREKAAMRDDAR